MNLNNYHLFIIYLFIPILLLYYYYIIIGFSDSSGIKWSKTAPSPYGMYYTPLKVFFWFVLPQVKSLQIYEWERYGYSHLFFMNWENIFTYIRKSMRTSFPYMGIVWAI